MSTARAILFATLLAAATAGLWVAPVQAQSDNLRVRHTINEGWRYTASPQGHPERPAYADSSWEAVDLPHTWNATDAFDDDLTYRRGIGWYRRALTLPDSLRGRRLILYFEGANQVADVYVNGQHAGQHVGGYTAFAYDVTDLVRFDGPNTIAVRVNNEHDPDIPPLNADFTFYGGIYRDVWLIATHPIHLDVTTYAAPGVYIDTPEASQDAAAVRVRATVVNQSEAEAEVRVEHRILDPGRSVVATLDTTQRIPAEGRASFEHVTTPLRQPKLWSPESPSLYRVETLVYAGDALVDRTVHPFGIRWFEASGDGFRLNGEPLALYGTNRHQDRPRLGNAIPDAAHREDVRIIDDMGFNFLRLAHYPQDPVVLDEADRRGLIVWEEAPVVNRITLSDAFGDHAETMVVEMIRQHYNHPSVVMWGYMNEIMLAPPDPAPEGYYEALLNLTKRLEQVVKEEDPSRLTVTAQSYHEIYNGKGVSDVPDVLGMNLYFGWYYEDPMTLGAFLDSLHAAHPERPLLVSEYGAGSDERVHTTTPERFDFSTEYQQHIHETAFAQMRDRPYMVGSAVWNQFDFGSNHRQDTKHAINQKGLYFFDRTPKDIAAYYRAQLQDTTVLHIATRLWRQRVGSFPGAHRQQVKVYTNMDSLTLLHGTTSLGTKAVQNSTAEWTVPFTQGANVLTAQDPSEIHHDRVTVHYEDRAPFFASPTSAVASVAINVGAHYQHIDGYDVVWEAEPDTSGTRPWGYEGGTPVRSHRRITGTPDDPLFQSARTGAFTYALDVPPGTYTVALLFAELKHEAAGERVFDVRINGRTAVDNLDLAGAFGPYRGVTKTTVVTVAEDEGLTIALRPERGEPILNGLRVVRQP